VLPPSPQRLSDTQQRAQTRDVALATLRERLVALPKGQAHTVLLSLFAHPADKGFSAPFTLARLRGELPPAPAE
jgi:hypothetical protein